jgi:SIR2-like domain
VASRREENRTRLNALAENLALKTCTPFLGSGASAPNVPTGTQMAKHWATRFGYPFPDDTNLSRVMQFVATMEYSGDPVTLKQRLIMDHIANATVPDFGAPYQVHQVLANCGLPLYVTTNYDDFMFRVLDQMPDLSPRLGISPWYVTDSIDRPASPLDKRYTPSPREPLVFHLHGHHSEPRSLVLTEDDNIDYLVREAGDSRPGGPAPRVIPDYVRGKLRTTSLLGSPQKRNHVSIQLNPGQSAAGPDCKFLEQYLATQNIWIFWETTEEFMKKLTRRLRRGGKP